MMPISSMPVSSMPISSMPVSSMPVSSIPVSSIRAAGLPSPGAGQVPADPAKLRKAAQDFEAMAIGQLLEPMFATVDTSKSMFGGGSAENMWKPVMVQEMAKHLAAHGGIGLARPVLAAMLRMQEAKDQ